jgi:replicative DNA helicase
MKSFFWKYDSLVRGIRGFLKGKDAPGSSGGSGNRYPENQTSAGTADWDRRHVSELLPSFPGGRLVDEAVKADLSSGILLLDRLVGGLRKGQLMVIGGRPAMGKTRILTRIASHVSVSDKVLYISPLRSKREVVQSFLFHLTGLESYALAPEEENSKAGVELAAASDFLKDNHLWISDFCATNPRNWYHWLRRLIATDTPDVVIVDSFDDLIPAGGKGDSSDLRRECALMLHRIARECHVVVLVSSGLSREIEIRGGDYRPLLKDLGRNHYLECVAETVVMLYRSAYYCNTVEEDIPYSPKMELIVKKSPGRVGVVEV